jgi:hypothetical protein
MLTKDALAIISECQERRVPVFISAKDFDITFQTLVRHTTPSQVVIDNMVKPDHIRRFAGASRFFLQCKMLRLQTDKVEPFGPQMIFPIQENSMIEETRQSERFMFTPEDRVVAELLNPYDNETRFTKPVMDMSATGLSLRAPFSTAMFAPGVKLPEIKILIDGKPYGTVAATIVYNRKFVDLAGRLRVQVGCKFEERLET